MIWGQLIADGRRHREGVHQRKCYVFFEKHDERPSLTDNHAETNCTRLHADAVRIGRLHVHREGWADANVKFMGSGGFNVSSKVPGIYTETLILWGRQDKILDPKLYAQR